MTSPVPLVFWTILALGPIPIWHLLLHSFLPFWKRCPWAFYGAGVGLWGLFVPLSHDLACRSSMLFVSGPWVRLICLSAGIAALLITLWSIQTLTPRRFFVWAVLRPQENAPELIRRGPYRFAAHPTYVSMLVTVAASFLASGQVILLGVFWAMAFLLTLVMVLEQRELRSRLKASFVPPDTAVPPSPAPEPTADVMAG